MTSAVSAGSRPQAAQNSDCQHRLRPVDQGDRLLGFKHQRLDLSAPHCFTTGTREAFSSRHSPSPMSANAKCASGARSPLAPTLPCEAPSGYAAIQHLANRIDDSPRIRNVLESEFARSNIMARFQRRKAARLSSGM